MKKIFTLIALFALTMGASAQDYRKSWDFTKWSATTVANLQAEAAKVTVAADGTSVTDGGGALWSDCEKASGNTTYGISKDNCYWQTGNSSGGIVLTANGETIAETEGLTFTNGSARNLAIAVNYGDCSSVSGAGFGPYHGGSYLWLGGSKKDYFVIPGVKPGTPIKMGVESHKLTDSRGVELYIVAGPTALTKGTKLTDINGNAVVIPNEYTDLEWYLPEEIPAADVDKAAEDGTYNILVYNTNGCHIYYITVGDGDSPQVEDAKKVAYLTGAATDLDADLAYIMMDGSDKLDVTVVPAAEGLTAASLAADFDAVVIAPTLSAAEAAIVKPLIAFIPVVNLSSAIYEPLGLGKAVDTDVTELTLVDASNAIFEGLDAISYDGGIAAVELGDYFANDAVLAKAGDAVAIHAHNAGRNAYYYVPGTNLSEDVFTYLIPQVVVAAAKTKRDIAAVGTPVISIVQNDGLSTVTITAANSKAIYYTLDGSEPTTGSTLYTEPFDVYSACTVKAFATGDGFTDSQVAEKQVTIAQKAATPAISIAREDGKSIVTLTCATSGVDLYYNFAGQSATTASVKYTEPFEVTLPATVTAFAAAAEGILASDLAQQFVGVNGFNNQTIRWDVVAHFDANADDWKGKGQQKDDAGNIVNANYFFTWGKNAGLYWDETSEMVQKVDGEGNPLFEEDGETPVMTYTQTLEGESFDPGNGWIIKSIGQVMVWESLSIGWNIGDTSMRNPDTAEDAIGVNDEEGITANAVTFGKQPTDGPFNASLETTAKYAGPFDVIVYAGNGNDGEIPHMQVETSADGSTWTKLGDVDYSLTKRNWKKTLLSYEATDEVYVRILHTAAKSSGQVYDVYVMKNGEKSQQYAEQGSGIVSVQPAGNVVRTELFTADGKRVASAQRGIYLVRRTYQNGSVRTDKVIR